ncbi:MAG: hypothetical protein IE921_10715 [Rhodobacteraceae bacterium]|nr:hypothetical protein [Paracoccaceae bacterium]
MFETSFPPAAHAGSADGMQLHAFAWPELVARLAAAQELRGLLAGRRYSAAGSFDGGAAGHLARRGNDERAVNPIALAHDKPDAANSRCVANGATSGDREYE